MKTLVEWNAGRLTELFISCSSLRVISTNYVFEVALLRSSPQGYSPSIDSDLSGMRVEFG